MAPKSTASAGSKRKVSAGGEPLAKRTRSEKKTAPMSDRRIAPVAAAMAAKERRSRPAAAAAAAAAAAGAGEGAEYAPTAPLPPLAATLHEAMLDRAALAATVAASAKAIAVQAMLELSLKLAEDDKEEDVPLPDSPKRLSPLQEELEKSWCVAFILESKNGPVYIDYQEKIQCEEHVHNDYGPATVRTGWVFAHEVQSLCRGKNELVLGTYVFYAGEKFKIPNPLCSDGMVFVINPYRDQNKEGMDLLFNIAKHGMCHDGLSMQSDGLMADQIFRNYARIQKVSTDLRTAVKVNQLIDKWRASGDLRIAPPCLAEYDRGFPSVAV